MILPQSLDTKLKYQIAAVKYDKDISEWMCIKRGVKQGCVASHHLLELYSEIIYGKIDNMDCFRIGGTVMNNLRYDMAIISKFEDQLHSLINVVVPESKKCLFTSDERCEKENKNSKLYFHIHEEYNNFK